MDVDALEAALNNIQIDETTEQDGENYYGENLDETNPQTDIQELVSQRVNEVLSEILTFDQKKAFQAKKCFNCGETGHYARNCKKPRWSLPRSSNAKNIQNKSSSQTRKFNNNKQQWRKQQFNKINEMIQQLDDEEEVAELYTQHAEGESATSQQIVDFVSDD